MDQPNPTSPIPPVTPDTTPLVIPPVTVPVTPPVTATPLETPAGPTALVTEEKGPVTPPTDPTSSSNPTIAAEIESGKKGPNFKIVLLIAMGVVIGLLGLLYFVLIFLSKPQVSPIVKEALKPVVVEEIIKTPPSSKFASDSAVIKLRTDLRALMGRIDTVDFFEAQVAPPSIDNAISIQP